MKDRFRRAAAVVGFIALIIVIAWLSIKLVSFIPNAVSSLASLADSVYNHTPAQVVITTDATETEHNDPVSLTWEKIDQNGTYVFRYECQDGVSVEISTGGPNQPVICDVNFPLGEATEAEMTVFSEKSRFADVVYSIGFIPARAEEPSTTQTDTVTVENPDIGLAERPEETEEEPSTPSTPTDEPATEEPPAKTPTTPTTPRPPVTAPTYTYTYGIPQSDPKGVVDLRAAYVSTGMIVNGQYVRTAVLDNDGRGAVQFEIKNLGTKTSDDWSFILTLPNNETITSGTQKPLKPNERTLLTVSFDLDDETGSESLIVTAVASNDGNYGNNAFTTTININE